MTKLTEFPQLESKAGLSPRRKRFSLRFSLLSLLIVAAVVCVGAAFYGMQMRAENALRQMLAARLKIKQQEAEIARLRSELGYLTIADKTKVHALQLPSHQQWHWKWRIYLPPERRWNLFHGAGQIPATGYEKVPFGMGTLEGGEFTLELFIERSLDGEPVVVCRTANFSTRNGISPDDFESLQVGGSSWSAIGVRRMEVREPGPPIEILRFRKHEKIAGTTASRTSDDPQFGFLLWIEEAKPGE